MPTAPQKPPSKKMEPKISIATVITLCLAIGGMVWAVSTELHNYRLTNITDRLKSHEDMLREGVAHDAEQDRAIEHITTQLSHFAVTLEEVRTDVKVLIQNGH